MASTKLEALVRSLDESQWWTEENLHRHQASRLAAIVEHAVTTVPFYHERFDALGLNSRDCHALGEWAALKPVTRQEVQGAGDAIHSTSVPNGHGTVAVRFTSGSTAVPVQILGTQWSHLIWQAMTMRDHRWHRRKFSETLATIRYFTDGVADPPHGRTLMNWGKATQQLGKTGPLEILSVFATTAQQSEWLQRRSPSYLLTYPTIVRSLTEHRQLREFRLPNLREIRTFGEALDPDVRQQIQEAWNVPVVDIYSAEETGYIALQCPEHEHYHVMADDLIVEVLDEQEEQCQPGRIGRVVVTTLNNYAMPLLRYDIGDYAEVGESCSCGRGLPVLKRILGRSRNMIVHPNGDRVFPSLEMTDEKELLQLPIHQYQVVQGTSDSLDVNLVAGRPLTAEEEAVVTRSLHRTVRYAFSINYNYVNTIPRGPTGKYEEFRCDVR